jgi:UDP-N-acetylmuramyl pentapeptide phosphotransferase/UDP-N-acetylglucosamine-1-phosphate transferase
MLTVVAWLLVPVVDCLRVMATRALHGRSPLEADENHLHHRLARQWRWPICLGIYLGIVTVPGLSAALWPDLSLVMILLTLSCYGGLLGLTQGRAIARPIGSSPGAD